MFFTGEQKPQKLAVVNALGLNRLQLPDCFRSSETRGECLQPAGIGYADTRRGLGVSKPQSCFRLVAVNACSEVINGESAYLHSSDVQAVK